MCAMLSMIIALLCFLELFVLCAGAVQLFATNIAFSTVCFINIYSTSMLVTLCVSKLAFQLFGGLTLEETPGAFDIIKLIKFK